MIDTLFTTAIFLASQY